METVNRERERETDREGTVNTEREREKLPELAM